MPQPGFGRAGHLHVGSRAPLGKAPGLALGETNLARIFVIDAELRAGQTLVDQLRRLGHAPDLKADFSAAQAGLDNGDYELVFACAGEGTNKGLAEAWMGLGCEVPLIWCGRLLEDSSSLIEAGIGAGFLALPPRLPALMSLLQRHLAEARDAGWSGQGFLNSIDGPAHRYPPARVVFLAHRVGASGTLHIGDARVVLRSGKIADCHGVPDLLGSDGSGLMAALGACIGAGTPPDSAMVRASEEIGAWLISDQIEPALPVRYVDETATAKRSPVSLPTAIPRMLLEAVRARGSARERRVALIAEGNPAFRVCAPGDAPPAQWGLSPVALRVLRAATRRPALLDLLDDLGGAERDDLWEAIDFLLVLGLLRMGADDGLPPEREGARVEAVGGAVSISMEALQEAVGRSSAKPAVEPPELAALRTELARVSALPPWELFAIEAPAALEPDALGQQLRALSRNHHPDQHGSASAALRDLHEQCFAVYADAHGQLQEEPVRKEVRARLRAKADGVPYVSDDDRARARLLKTKGEHALRQKRWDDAVARLGQAAAADPLDFSIGLALVEAQWRAGEATPEECLERILVLKPDNRGERGALAYLRGELRVAGGDDNAAHPDFEEVLDMIPGHVGAQRRVRMHERRKGKEAQATRKSGIASFFGFGKGS